GCWGNGRGGGGDEGGGTLGGGCARRAGHRGRHDRDRVGSRHASNCLVSYTRRDMDTRWVVLAAMLSCFFAPLSGEAQPTLEQLRFDPPQLCFRDQFRWGFAYRALPGGLAAVKDLELSARWEGPDERPVRSLLTPTRDELQRYSAEEGRFESYLLHLGAPRKAPGEVHYTLRVVLADGREITSATSIRYVDGCPPAPLY